MKQRIPLLGLGKIYVNKIRACPSPPVLCPHVTRLDVLVYADMNSEPVSHFLGFSRLASVQAVFWGNPITTGVPHRGASPPFHLYENPSNHDLRINR